MPNRMCFGPMIAIIAALSSGPAAAGEIMVFFDTNSGQPGSDVSCELSNSAQELVGAIVEMWNKEGKPQIELVGHDDTSKADDVSLAVSKCRAEAVAAAMQARGVPGDKLKTSWQGESAPAIDVGDGVKEPLNRRVNVSW